YEFTRVTVYISSLNCINIENCTIYLELRGFIRISQKVCHIFFGWIAQNNLSNKFTLTTRTNPHPTNIRHRNPQGSLATWTTRTDRLISHEISNKAVDKLSLALSS